MKLSELFHKRDSSGRSAAPLEDGLHFPVQLRFVAATDNGRSRDHNEDYYFTQIWQANKPNTFPIGLFILADGMGGHLHGEVASKLAVDSVSVDLSQGLIAQILQDGLIPNADSVLASLVNAYNHAQQEVCTQAQGSGTTLTLALLLDRQLYYAHVGDSRLYLCTRSEGLSVLTVDHTLVRRLVDLGQLQPEEARSHPQRNILFRALGQGDGFKVDTGQRTLSEASTLMLCCDGLWGSVEEAQLARYLHPGRPNEETARRLVSLANEAGGPDNITTIVVSVV